MSPLWKKEIDVSILNFLKQNIHAMVHKNALQTYSSHYLQMIMNLGCYVGTSMRFSIKTRNGEKTLGPRNNLGSFERL